MLHGKYQDPNKICLMIQKASPSVARLLKHAVVPSAPFLELPKILTGFRNSKSNFRRKMPAKDAADPPSFRVWWRQGREREDFETSKSKLLPYLVDTDVVFGFSQGAAMASLLLREHLDKGVDFSPKLVVLYAGYNPDSEWSKTPVATDVPRHDMGSETKIIVVGGCNDNVVPLDRSRQLAKSFGADMLIHSHGHRVAKDDLISQKIVEEAKIIEIDEANHRFQGVLEIRNIGGQKGYGVFALRDFKPGEFVFRANALFVEESRSTHTIQVSSDTHVHMDLPGRYLNHSCSANLGVRNNNEGAYDFHVASCCGQGVKAGEELVFDYETTEYSSIQLNRCGCLAKPCPSCGKGGCRGKVTGFKDNGNAIVDLYGTDNIADYLVSHS